MQAILETQKVCITKYSYLYECHHKNGKSLQICIDKRGICSANRLILYRWRAYILLLHIVNDQSSRLTPRMHVQLVANHHKCIQTSAQLRKQVL